MHYSKQIDLAAGESVLICPHGSQNEALCSAMLFDEDGCNVPLEAGQICHVCEKGAFAWKFTAIADIKGQLNLCAGFAAQPDTFCWPSPQPE